MKIDLVSIFPEFFDVLDLSLIGKAQQDGLLSITRHDLRDFTFDKHRSVDSPPVGGGAGMVMKPEPVALALEHVLASASPAGQAPDEAPAENVSRPGPESGSVQKGKPVLIIPTPSGRVFTQRTAEELAQHEHLVFTAGRFEGIDHRLAQWAETDFEVLPLSIGDYVLNGGEAAIVVMVEAIVRLVPGVLGNPESLTEESHSGEGLLEYPVYTKPPTWRGHEVPSVLLSGDHARIAQWRREQSEERTRAVRPDLWRRREQDEQDR